MKKLFPPMFLLASLFSCNDPAVTTTGSASTDSASQNASPPFADTTNASRSAGNVADEFPAAKAGDVVEEVIPPNESDTLKFCYITKWIEQNGQLLIDADYIQFYYGDRALEEAKKRNDAEMDVRDGDTTYSVPSDIYLLNENKRVRQLPMIEDVRCFTIAAGEGKMVLQRTDLQRLRKRWDPTKIYIIILNKSNAVTAIKEQYLP